jgi:NAD(P)-dependent dehydrogenase (short-subunit alcohol dehydrogenase family)
MDIIRTTPKARVVNVSSIAHRQGKMDFSNLLYENGNDYTPMKAYGRSKLENLLFTSQLQKYFEEQKIDAIAVVAHPGVSNTNLFNNISSKWLMAILKPLFGLFVQPASMGALSEIRAAVDASVKGGEYYGPDGNKEMKGYPVLVQPDKSAYNEADAPKLWEFSEEITGVKFN